MCRDCALRSYRHAGKSVYMQDFSMRVGVQCTKLISDVRHTHTHMHARINTRISNSLEIIVWRRRRIRCRTTLPNGTCYQVFPIVNCCHHTR